MGVHAGRMRHGAEPVRRVVMFSARLRAARRSGYAGFMPGFPALLSAWRRSIIAGCALAVAAIATLHPMSAQVARPAADPCASGAPRNRIDACSQVLLRVPLDARTKVTALVNRASAHDALDERALALDDYRAALAVEPGNVSALRGRAGVQYRSGQTTAALTDLSRAIQLAPDDAASFRLRGDIRAETGDPVHAIEDYSKVLDHLPSDVLAREGRGLALAASGDHARAVQDFSRVLERNPRARVARAARAFSLFQLKRYAPAITDWDQLVSTNPSELSFLYCRGAAKMLNGDVAGGQADIQVVMQTRPEVAAAQAAACGAVRSTP